MNTKLAGSDSRDGSRPANDSFWDCPNLILTQHSDGGHADEADRQVAFVLANFRRYLEGAELVCVADIRRGN
ncbi:MAG: hypothetical protein OXF74_09050 [Rhodobacteraceae bacterium]|nr:hypothetical protein [Paracoccaceae bacterium]